MGRKGRGKLYRGEGGRERERDRVRGEGRGRREGGREGREGRDTYGVKIWRGKGGREGVISSVYALVCVCHCFKSFFC